MHGASHIFSELDSFSADSDFGLFHGPSVKGSFGGLRSLSLVGFADIVVVQVSLRCFDWFEFIIFEFKLAEAVLEFVLKFLVLHLHASESGLEDVGLAFLPLLFVFETLFRARTVLTAVARLFGLGALERLEGSGVGALGVVLRVGVRAGRFPERAVQTSPAVSYGLLTCWAV